MFWNHFSRFNDNVAFKYYSNNELIEVKYKEFERLCKNFSSQLPQYKSIILISADSSVECFAAIFGALQAQHTVILTDNNNFELQTNLSEKYKPNFIYQKKNQEWVLKLNRLEKHESLHKDLAVILSTSGSSGSSKCVRLSYENLNSNAESIASYLSITTNDLTALTLPAHYSYGISIINSHLSTGAATFIGEISIVDDNFIKFLKQEKITSIAGVPYSYEIYERIGLQDENLPALKYITQAGGRLNKHLVKKFSKWARDNNKLFYVMYGQTEASPRIAYVPPELINQYPDCIGIAIKGGALSLIDDQGEKILQADTPGELVYQGPNVMLGYAECLEDLNKGNETEILFTGDIACFNQQGLYYLAGRKKRITKIYGKRLNLDEVEMYIGEKSHDVACVSDDERLYLCSKRNIEPRLLELIESKFSIDGRDIHPIKLETMPVLSNQKIDYQSLLEYAQINSASVVENPTSEDNVDTIKEIKSIFTKKFPNTKISNVHNFSDLGGDSLSYVSISIELERFIGKLPVNWNKLSIEELSCYNKNESNKFFVTIEITIFLRAYAILAIVANHAGLKFFAGGATLLILVYGFNFRRFHLNNLLTNKTLRIIIPFFKYVLLPYWIIIFSYSALRLGELPELRHIFLMSNVIDVVDERGFNFWFVSAITHMTLILILIFKIKYVQKLTGIYQQYFLFICLILSLSLILLNSHFGLTDYIAEPRKHTLYISWLFFFGMIVYVGSTTFTKVLQFSLLLGLGFYFYANDIIRFSSLILGGGMLILLTRITVPKLFIPSIQVISSASLFIYFLHKLARVDSYTSTWSVDVIRIGSGILIGILFWFIYTKTLEYLEHSIIPRISNSLPKFR